MMKTHAIIFTVLALSSCTDHPTEPSPTRFNGKIVFGAVREEGSGYIYSDVVMIEGDGTTTKLSSADSCYTRRPFITRDGTKVAFTSCTHRTTKVFIYETATGMLRNITYDQVIEEFPTWSPDGRYLAFISFRDGHRNIFCLDDATGDVQKVSGSDGAYWSGNWTPDNATLCYYGYAVGQSSQIYLFDLHSLTSRVLTSGAGTKQESTITPDGQLLAYQKDWRLHFLTADGTIDTLVTNAPDSVRGPMGWSSSGDFLVFQGLVNGRWDIYRLRRNGTGLVNLTADFLGGQAPVLSPDDAEIAFVASTVSKIYLMNNDGTNKRPLTRLNQREFSPSWGN